MAYKYCTATSWGKDFFTYQDRKDFYLRGHHGNVWVVGDNYYGRAWIDKVSGVSKTKAEAQAIVDGIVEEAQTVWDALPAEEKVSPFKPRPVKIDLL